MDYWPCISKGRRAVGSEIASDSSDFQADVRNRWSDGSAKFAVLSGISGFSQGLPKEHQPARDR